MSRTSTSSSRASGRSRRTDRRYDACPLCGSRRITLGSERLEVAGRKGETVEVHVRRWACPECQESFLTANSRRKLDAALGLSRD